VASIDVGEQAGEGIVLGVEEGRVAIGGGGFVDQVIDVTDESGEITLPEAGDAAEAGAQAGHEEQAEMPLPEMSPRARARRPSLSTKKS